jgi:ABC-type transporter Mla MlaB component
MEPTVGSVATFRLPAHLSTESWRVCVIDALTALEAARGRLVVECEAVESFDDDGIALLLGLSRHSEGRQIRVELLNAPAGLRENLEFRGLAWLFEWRPVVV